MTQALQKTRTSPIEENIRQWKQARPDLDLGSLLFLMSALRLGKVIEEDWDRACVERFGLRSNDMRVLLALRRSGPPFAKRPTDLFRSLLVTSGAITKQVNRLAKLDLVERLPDPAHGGGWLVHLTVTGKKTADAAAEMIASEGVVHDALMQMPRHR